MKLKKIALLVTLALGMLTTGCNAPEEKPEVIVEEFLQDFKNMDYQGMYSLTHDGQEYFKDIYIEDEPSNVKIFEALSNNMDYNVGESDVKFSGKEATVTVNITNTDSNEAMVGVINDFLDAYKKYEDELEQHDMDAELENIIVNRLSKDSKTQTTQTVFNLLNKDDKWVIESNIMIYDDVTGGYLTYYFQNNYVNTVVQ